MYEMYYRVFCNVNKRNKEKLRIEKCLILQFKRTGSKTCFTLNPLVIGVHNPMQVTFTTSHLGKMSLA